ncbi:MAG: glucokinase [Vicinamibacterales bacterium]
MLLAGDVGGTKTLLALFERHPVRPALRNVRSFPTTDFEHLSDIVDAFLEAEGLPPNRVEAACFGVAGPVLNGSAQLTNVGWTVSAADFSTRLGIPNVRLLNDLEAMAWSLAVLTPTELEVLQAGETSTHGTVAIIAAGTGLGTAILHRAGGTFVPVASEGGHVDFAPRTPREIELLRAMLTTHGRVQLEDLLSGPGLIDLHRFTHKGTCPALPNGYDPKEAPAAISTAAIEGRCADCEEALDLFVSIYGSAAGNLALTAAAIGGVYIGGGIAPKILPALRDGRFMKAFSDKSPMESLLGRVTVQVILNHQAGLLGAAVHGNRL